MVDLMTGEAWSALRLSLQVAVCAALAGLPWAIAVGYLLACGAPIVSEFLERRHSTLDVA